MPIQYDATGVRRKRTGKPQPLGKRRKDDIEADCLLLEALYEFKALSTHHLYPFASHRRQNYQVHQNRLTHLANEVPQLISVYGPKSLQSNVYRITKDGEAYLRLRDRLPPHVPRDNDQPNHKMYNGIVGASLKLGLNKKGLDYLSTSDIVARSNCPQATKDMEHPLQIPLKNHYLDFFIPDRLLASQFPNIATSSGRPLTRFYFEETDRGTIPVWRFRRDKLEPYVNMMEHEKSLEQFGFRMFTVLTVTNSLQRIEHILEQLREMKVKPEYAQRFAFQAVPDIAQDWRIPENVLYDLVEKPWTTIDGTFDITKP